MASYALTEAEAGKTAKVRVAFAEDGGTEATLTSAAAIARAFTARSVRSGLRFIPAQRMAATGSRSLGLAQKRRIAIVTARSTHRAHRWPGAGGPFPHVDWLTVTAQSLILSKTATQLSADFHPVFTGEGGNARYAGSFRCPCTSWEGRFATVAAFGDVRLCLASRRRMRIGTLSPWHLGSTQIAAGAYCRFGRQPRRRKCLPALQ